jgi:peptide/nickel transport system substrate-binding protein
MGPTLVMESSPETSITQDYNPFNPNLSLSNMGVDGLIYEPLIEFDIASPPTYYPWLATGFTWSDGGKAITFAIRQGVKWNNGTPFTAADVAFTYNMVKANAALNLNGLTYTSVTTSGNNVTLTFPSAQYANIESIASIAIVPQAIWSKVNPVTYTDADPVGTGPYEADAYTAQGVTLKTNPGYWQESLIHVPRVYFPVYTSNTGAFTALNSGSLAWAGNFFPGLQKDFVDTSPSTHHYWEAAGSSNALYPNLTVWPTNQLPVRQAISAAISRTLIADEGEAGLENPVLNATGLTLPTYSAWSGPVADMTVSANADPAAAEQILEKAGYTKGSNGYFQKGGKTVALTIVDPAAYTDYAEDDALVAAELKAAGIDATFDGIAVTAWADDMQDGDFQLAMHWGANGVTPYNGYAYWLNSADVTKAGATADFERLNDPTLDTDLAALAGASTTAEQTTDLVPLEQYVAANVPVIPTVTASDWFEYNSQSYTGWPTQSNPYQAGQPAGNNIGGTTGSSLVVILHLRPAS